MPGFNPFVGDSPQFTGGAVNVSSGDSASGVIGAVDTNDPSTKYVPQALATLVLVALGVIAAIHFAGIRGTIGASASVGN